MLDVLDLVSPELTPFNEPLVEIRPNDPFVKFCTSNIFQAVQRILMCVIFHEAEAAWCLLKAVEAHDKSFNLTTSVTRS